jgi:hypothetical protein
MAAIVVAGFAYLEIRRYKRESISRRGAASRFTPDFAPAEAQLPQTHRPGPARCNNPAGRTFAGMKT